MDGIYLQRIEKNQFQLLFLIQTVSTDFWYVLANFEALQSNGPIGTNNLPHAAFCLHRVQSEIRQLLRI